MTSLVILLEVVHLVSFETYPNPKVIGNICRDLLPNGGGGGILGPVPDTADSVTIQVDEITSYQYFLRDYHVDDMYTYGPNEMGNTLYLSNRWF